ncbi:MAG: hypothetical protein ABIP85_01775, partial [Chthoniobacteraceae bacterium]
MLHAILRPFAFFTHALSRAVPFFFGSLRFAWTPPPWLHASARSVAAHWRTSVVLLVLSAGVAYGAWRMNRESDQRNPRPILIAAAADTTPATAAKPATTPAAPSPKADPDVRDTSKPRVRAVNAHVNWFHPGWDEQKKKVTAAAFTINFSAPAAPLALIGKTAAAGTAKITPEVAGTWRWASSQQLNFEPQGGWMPPRDYTFQLGDGVFAPDCAVTLKKPHWRDWYAPLLTASFGDSSFYVDPATPALQQAVATVTFSQPVSREEVVRCLSVENKSETPLFVPGGKPQVLADEKNPLRFFLRSPLIKPGEKEDLVVFKITRGLSAISGGDPTGEEFLTKVTAPSRYSGFFFKSARTQIVTNGEGEPRQFIFLESSIAANNAVVGKAARAWQLPPPLKNKEGKNEPWTT